MFNLFKVCKFCKKRRFYVNYRKFILPYVNIKTTTNEKMCAKCCKLLDKLKNNENI